MNHPFTSHESGLRPLFWARSKAARILAPLRRLAVAMIALSAAAGAFAQDAADSTGAAVAIKIVNLGWDPNASGNSLVATITGLNGTQSTNTATTIDPMSSQIIARLAVGKTYSLVLNSSGLASVPTLLAVPPAGYVMEIDGVPREQYDLASGNLTVKLRVRPPVGSAPARAGVATALSTERTLWQVSLGSLANGDSAGTLSFIDVTTPGATGDVVSIFSPSGLIYDAPSSEVQVILNGPRVVAPYVQGTIRQILTPQVCVDVQLTGSNRCELKFYHRAQMSSAPNAGGLYDATGWPFVWYIFNENGTDVNAVNIVCAPRDITDSAGVIVPSSTAVPVVNAKMTTLARTGTTAPYYTWTATEWYLQSGSALSQEVRSRTDATTETLTTSAPGSSPVAQVKRTYAATPWGEEVVGIQPGVPGSGMNAPATTFDYWSTTTTGTQSAAYTRLRSRNTAGQWEAAEYYDYADGFYKAGALLRQHRPYNNSDTSVPANLAAHTGAVTTYDWLPDAYGRGTRLALMETKVAGTTTAKASIAYTDPAATTFPGHTYLRLVTATRSDFNSDGTSLTSITKYFREDAGDGSRYGLAAMPDDFFRGRPYSIQRPDGVKQSFAYQRGTWNGSVFTPTANNGFDPVPANTVSFASRTVVLTGSANASPGGTLVSTYGTCPIDPLYLLADSSSEPGVTKCKSTMVIAIRDTYARVVREERYAWNGGWQLVGATNYQWNLANQLLKRAVNDSLAYDMSAGAIYEATYTGEYLLSETSATGTVMSYTYDGAGRVATTAQAGAGPTIGALAAKFTYDAANHVTQQDVGHVTLPSVAFDQAELLTSSRTYDSAGRLLNEIRPGPNGPLTTSYAYSYSFEEPTYGWQVTATLPNGGTRIETYRADGSPASVTGTAVVSEYYTRSRDSSGNTWMRVNLGAAPSDFNYPLADASNFNSGSVRQRIAKIDRLGRTVQTLRPGFTGQPAFVEQATFDSTTGRLTKTQQFDDKGNQLLTDTLYEYDALSQVTRSGVKLTAGTTALTLASNDRLADSDQYVEFVSPYWWLTKRSKTYPKAGDGTAFTISTSRTRLTGLTGGTLGQSVSIDADGIATTRTVTIDRPNKTVTVTTAISSGYTNSQVETIVNGLATSVTGFDGVTYTTTYDALYRRSTSADPRKTAAGGAAAVTTTTYKSGSGYVSTVTNAKGDVVATYDYDVPRCIVRVLDANNQAGYTEYDLLGRVLHQWGDTAYPVEYGYDAFGARVTMKTYRAGSGWANTGTTVIPLANVSWPSAANTGPADTTTWNYDAPSGLLVSKVDAGGNAVGYTYNQLGQTFQRRWARHVNNDATKPLLTTTYGYDPQTAELTDISYNDAAEANPTPAVRYAYTRTGQLDFVSDGTGKRRFGYNATNPLQLDSVDLSPGGFYGNRVLARQYDSLHRPTGFKLGDGTTANLGADLSQVYSYNGLGQFDYLDTKPNAQVVRRFTYNHAFANSSMVSGYSTTSDSGTTPFATTLAYEGTRDLLASVDSKWNGASVTRYDYINNKLGQRYTTKQSGSAFADFVDGTNNAIYKVHGYDSLGELTTSADYLGNTPTPLTNPLTTPDSSAQLQGRNFAYSYDGLGNRLSASRTGTAGTADTFTPNNLNQYSNRTNNYAHTAGTVSAGNATNGPVNVSVTGGGVTSLVGRRGRYWDAQVTLNNHVGGVNNDGLPASANLSVTGTLSNGAGANIDLYASDSTRTAYIASFVQRFYYDEDGNLTGDGIWFYTYDAENRLTGLTTVPAAASAGFPNRALDFKYDYLGRRVQKRVYQTISGSTALISVRRYLYDGDNLVAEFDAPNGTSIGSLLKSYTWGLDISDSLDATGGVGALVQITDHNPGGTAANYFPTYDGNGNIASLVRTSDGAIVAKYEYSPFGELLRCEGAYAQSNPFRFSTKFTDDESGLVYYGARYYSPGLGRFINRDPIGEAGGLNLYGFCGNDGVNGYDYLGYSWLSKLWKGITSVFKPIVLAVEAVVSVAAGVYTFLETGSVDTAIAVTKGVWGLFLTIDAAVGITKGALSSGGPRQSSTRSPLVMNYNGDRVTGSSAVSTNDTSYLNDIVGFLGGVFSAWVHDNAPGTTEPVPVSEANRKGIIVGHAAAVAQGIWEMKAGGDIAALGVAAAAVGKAPPPMAVGVVAAGGSLAIHGALVPGLHGLQGIMKASMEGPAVGGANPEKPKADLNKIQKQIENRGLPTGGQTPFKPKLKRNSRGEWEIDKADITTGPWAGKRGYVDEQGRIWTKDPAHAGYPEHWDVQINGGQDYIRVGMDGNPVIKQ